MSRLIDADVLKETLLKFNYTTANNQIFRYIDEQPTIEAVPVVHGEWIRNENPIEISCECSICHAKDYWYDIDKANEYYWFHRNFCPNCGAKMEGDSV